MPRNLTSYEQETIINFNKKEKNREKPRPPRPARPSQGYEIMAITELREI